MNEVIEVERGNKIIAEFDGWVKTNDTVLGGAFWYKKERTTKLLYQMQYHSSWDWLMPVVEKIKDIDNQADIHDAVLLEKFKEEEESDNIFHTSIFCHIEAVWTRVITFIKWWNNGNK